ncbi:hypothetical protein Ae201684P_021075 [Aphanomyces euteiches]|nr:hypothetical protein Ae201684P_021075 [Aphanomyces euteiches]
MKVLQALLRGLPAATLLVLQTVTAAPTRAPTSAPTTAAPKNWACVRLDGVSLLYFPVTIDSNGDVAALSKTGFGVSLDNCKKTDVSKTPIYISCGCDYKDKSLGITTGYDLGPSHWCNTGKTALNAQPPNPDCIRTPAPTPSTTAAKTHRQRLRLLKHQRQRLRSKHHYQRLRHQHQYLVLPRQRVLLLSLLLQPPHLQLHNKHPRLHRHQPLNQVFNLHQYRRHNLRPKRPSN